MLYGPGSVSVITVPEPERFDPLPDDRAARWANFQTRQAPHFAGLLGLTIEDLRVGYCRMRLPFRTQHTPPAGIVHGGAIASLIDTSAVPAIGSLFDGPTPYSTIDMQVQYVGAAGEGTDLVATGWVTRQGRSVVFCRSEVATDGGEPVASGTLAFKVSRS